MVRCFLNSFSFIVIFLPLLSRDNFSSTISFLILLQSQNWHSISVLFSSFLYRFIFFVLQFSVIFLHFLEKPKFFLVSEIVHIVSSINSIYSILIPFLISSLIFFFPFCSDFLVSIFEPIVFNLISNLFRLYLYVVWTISSFRSYWSVLVTVGFEVPFNHKYSICVYFPQILGFHKSNTIPTCFCVFNSLIKINFLIHFDNWRIRIWTEGGWFLSQILMTNCALKVFVISFLWRWDEFLAASMGFLQC